MDNDISMYLTNNRLDISIGTRRFGAKSRVAKMLLATRVVAIRSAKIARAPANLLGTPLKGLLMHYFR